MALIPLLGTVGLGLMWGWLLGLVRERGKKPWAQALALGGATVALATGVLLLADWLLLAAFLAAALCAWLTHVLWRRQLRRRYGG
jgi:uncharacterized membrane protein